MGYYIGVMSGTSLDGVDAVLCKIDEGIKTIKSVSLPIDEALKERFQSLIASRLDLQQLGLLRYEISRLYIEAIKKLDYKQADAIGVHGQTIWHQGDSQIAFTLQLIDAALIAAECKKDVVYDIRSKDIACGGTGAPLAPLFHSYLLKGFEGAVVNIGGIANISHLGDSIFGYDIGPGNTLMDKWAQQHLLLPFDKDGAVAKSGTIIEPLLAKLRADSYFAQQPPKSTGVEYFNLEWLLEHLDNSYTTADVMRTLLELTASEIAQATLGVNQTLICGGGAQNSYLVERIKALSSSSIEVMENAADIEAMMMAWFAYMRQNNHQIDTQNVTGASRASILGSIVKGE